MAHVISYKTAAFGTNYVKFTEAIDPYCRQPKRSAGSLVFGNVWFVGMTQTNSAVSE